MSALLNNPVQIAREAWGDELPEWIEALAVECGASSQNQVARRLGRSGPLVSQVLRNKYQGSMEVVEELFNGAFRNYRVACPALGEMPANECRHWRERARVFMAHNPDRVKMYRACVRCPRNQKPEVEK